MCKREEEEEECKYIDVVGEEWEVDGRKGRHGRGRKTDVEGMCKRDGKGVAAYCCGRGGKDGKCVGG